MEHISWLGVEAGTSVHTTCFVVDVLLAIWLEIPSEAGEEAAD